MTSHPAIHRDEAALETAEEIAHSGLRPRVGSVGSAVAASKLEFVAAATLFALTALALLAGELLWSFEATPWVVFGIAVVQASIVVSAFMDRGKSRRSALLLLAIAGLLGLVLATSSVEDRNEYERDISRFERGH